MAFGNALAEARVSVAAPQLGAELLVEAWPSRDDIHFGAVAVAENGTSLEDVTCAAYTALIAQTRDAGYPHLLRLWHHVAGINAIEEGRERYKRFCEGRHNAFADAGYALANDLPAASAVGMSGEKGLVIYYLAGRRPGVQLENPRQVAAYRYPPQYGRKSPSFSRATVFEDVVFVSGTSSVLGHETVHAGDVDAQLEETLRNVEAVLQQTGGGLGDLAAVKTYVRRAADYERIASRLGAALPATCARIYLEADICRADLLLEIEGVARRG